MSSQAGPVLCAGAPVPATEDAPPGSSNQTYLGAFGLNRHWGLAFAMRRWDVERVDLAALGKCGSRIGLVASSARASSACEVPVVPVELAGGPNLKLAAILVTAVGPGNYLGLSVC